MFVRRCFSTDNRGADSAFAGDLRALLCKAYRIGSRPDMLGDQKLFAGVALCADQPIPVLCFSDLCSKHIAVGRVNGPIAFALIRERRHILVHFRNRSVLVYTSARSEQQHREQDGQHDPADPFGRFVFVSRFHR